MYGSDPPLVSVVVQGTFWLYSERSIFQVIVRDEDRDVWRLYLDKALEVRGVLLHTHLLPTQARRACHEGGSLSDSCRCLGVSCAVSWERRGRGGGREPQLRGSIPVLQRPQGPRTSAPRSSRLLLQKRVRAVPPSNTADAAWLLSGSRRVPLR